MKKAIKSAVEIPKAQPTRAYSESRANPRVEIHEVPTCPEVSDFQQSTQNSLCIHTLNFDYGHLQRPLSAAQCKLSPICEGIEQKATQRRNQEYHQISNIKLTAIKCKSVEKGEKEKRENAEREGLTNRKSCDKKNKLNEVWAMQKCQDLVITLRKPIGDRRVYTRLVKSYVAGGKITAKIIKYPDNKEYIRVCGIGR